MTEHREYKGQTVTVGSLANGDQVIPCQAIETTIPAGEGRWGRREQKISNLFLITNIAAAPNNDRTVITKRYPGKSSDHFIASQDFEIRILTGEQGQKMLAAYEQYCIGSLHHFLEYYDYLGSDPEIFVQNGKGDLIPAFEFLGPKDKPTATHCRYDYGQKKYGVYWDGFQAEFETEAVSCMAHHMDSVQSGLRTVFNEACKYDPTAVLSNQTVFEISREVLQNTKEEHVSLGCMPSFNAYGLKGELTSPRNLIYRPAGGHIHFGVADHSKEEYETMVKALDAITGVACVSLFANFDNPIRRQYYGLAGEYRTPPHGLEYRTLSNAWLMHPTLAHMTFEIARSSVKFGMNGFLPYWKASQEETVEVINNCDVDGARKILERNKVIFEKILIGSHLGSEGGTYEEDEEYYEDQPTDGPELAYNIFMQGAESAIAKPEDIVGNWKLESGWYGHSDAKNACWFRSIADLSCGKLI